jgi:NAD-dependent SIR2 family protein deacetylase
VSQRGKPAIRLARRSSGIDLDLDLDEQPAGDCDLFVAIGTSGTVSPAGTSSAAPNTRDPHRAGQP